MKADYTYWRSALAGEKPKMFVDEPQLGFYRKPIRERNEKGNNKTIGYEAVAIFIASGEMTAQVGDWLVTDRDKINELWSWVAGNAVTEDAWRAVAERDEPWPDFSINSASKPDSVKLAPEAPEEKVAREIAEAKKNLPAFAKIESDEQSSKARSLQQRFLDARGAAAKAYEAANRPLLKQQKKLREVWFPLRDEADAANETIRAAMGAWEDQKREAARKAAAEAERKAREHAEAVRKAEEANQPPPPPPMESKPNTPPPSAQIRAPGARAASVRVRNVVTEIDVDKAFAQFKAAAEVREVLMKLAQRAVDAGLPVDGATIEERSEVR